ncbi:hypothetical protein BLA60_35645 [Actinophytocola xinjiangensis]|uniref:Uncharacterized protein n=1 Tax=Actinophytocola xinjiangensis TaxID=485602 RepID=A0A7Z1AUW4_9PSEU|nr:hypothetical protein BLA60_35645 [Actinophytocola xinjiangensis]
MDRAPGSCQKTVQIELRRPQVFIVDGPTISVQTCGPVHRTILQCIAEVDEPPAQGAFIRDAHLITSSGVRVEKPENVAGNLVVDAGQFGHEHQLVVPVRSGHRFTHLVCALPLF